MAHKILEKEINKIKNKIKDKPKETWKHSLLQYEKCKVLYR